MKKQMNNKGFSLVELIVVIAIMAILAVTLAPRLSQYVEKSRVAKDREIITAIMTATSLGFLEEDVFEGYTTIADPTPALPDAADSYSLDLNVDTIYTRATGTKEWTMAATSANAFVNQIHDIVGNFEFSSSKADENAVITIDYDVATEVITVSYDADGTTSGNGDTYTLTK